MYSVYRDWCMDDDMLNVDACKDHCVQHTLTTFHQAAQSYPPGF